MLELGCGHGLPGIVAALHGARVTFQVFFRWSCHGMSFGWLLKLWGASCAVNKGHELGGISGLQRGILHGAVYYT